MRISRPLVMLLVLLLTASLIAQDNAAKEKFNAGVKAKQANNLTEAEKEFQAAVAAYPQYKEAWLELGSVRFELNKGALSEEAFQKAIALDPTLMPAYYNLGMVQLKAKKYTLAEASLKKSLELAKNDPKTMKALGQLYLLQKKRCARTALRTRSWAAVLSPNGVSARVWMSRQRCLMPPPA